MTTQLLDEFQYNGTPIEVLGTPDKPLFIAKEICNALGYVDHESATRRLDDDEKGAQNLRTPGGKQKMTVINEPGLYNLVLRSTKPEAKAFKRWLTHEVLPSIRKKGYYATPGAVRKMVRRELAKERLAEYLYCSDIWSEATINRLVQLKGHRDLEITNNELARMFQCSASTIRKAYRLMRHAKGDFTDARPDNLKPDNPPHLELLNGMIKIPATAEDKAEIWRMRRKDELSFTEIGELTGYSPSACRRFYRKEVARRGGQL